MPTKCIRCASSGDVEAVNGLRTTCYQRAEEFEVIDLDLIMWDINDTVGQVLGAFDGDQLLATLRGNVVLSALTAEGLLGCSVDLDAGHFPALVLGRAATEPRVGRMGLHSALRYHLIRDGTREGIRSVLGMVYNHAPRTNVMRDIGYEFHRPNRLFDLEAVPVTDVALAVLPEDRITDALASLERRAHDTLVAFKYSGVHASFAAHAGAAPL